MSKFDHLCDRLTNEDLAIFASLKSWSCDPMVDAESLDYAHMKDRMLDCRDAEELGDDRPLASRWLHRLDAPQITATLWIPLNNNF
jgi:hypothetical protein